MTTKKRAPTKEENDARAELWRMGGLTQEQIETMAEAIAERVVSSRVGEMEGRLNAKLDQIAAIARTAVMRSEDAAQGMRNIGWLVCGDELRPSGISEIRTKLETMETAQAEDREARIKLERRTRLWHRSNSRKLRIMLQQQGRLHRLLLGLHAWLKEEDQGHKSRYYKLARWIVVSAAGSATAVSGGYAMPWIHPRLMHFLHRLPFMRNH